MPIDPLANQAGAAQSVAEPQFQIPATISLQERRPRTLKHGDMFAVFDHHGDAIGSPGSTDGLYYRDTRYLSWCQLRINGVRPLLLGSTLRDDNATLTCDLTNPDINGADTSLEHDVIHIRRSCFLWNATCYQRLSIRNFGQAPCTLRVEIVFAADFADIFEARGHAPGEARNHAQRPAKQDCRDHFLYRPRSPPAADRARVRSTAKPPIRESG